MNRSRHKQMLLVAALAVATASLARAETWTARDGSVVVRCPMTVGGSFEARSQALSGSLERADDPATVSGSLKVDLSTLDTGIELRNRHLKENYLEVEKGDGFSHAVLSNLKLEGTELAKPAGDIAFTATFTLHGIEREVKGTAKLEPKGAGLAVTATFPVHLPDFEIKKPRHLGIGVRDTVEVEIGLVLDPSDGAQGSQS